MRSLRSKSHSVLLATCVIAATTVMSACAGREWEFPGASTDEPPRRHSKRPTRAIAEPASAAEAIQRSLQVYATCTRYVDHGAHTTTHLDLRSGKSSTDKAVFSTFFARDQGFSHHYVKTSDLMSTGIVWAHCAHQCGEVNQVISSVMPKAYEAKSPREGLSTDSAFGFPVASTFYLALWDAADPETLLSRMKEPLQLASLDSNGVACWNIKGTVAPTKSERAIDRGDMSVSIDIEKETGLVRSCTVTYTNQRHREAITESFQLGCEVRADKPKGGR